MLLFHALRHEVHEQACRLEGGRSGHTGLPSLRRQCERRLSHVEAWITDPRIQGVKCGVDTVLNQVRHPAERGARVGDVHLTRKHHLGAHLARQAPGLDLSECRDRLRLFARHVRRGLWGGGLSFEEQLLEAVVITLRPPKAILKVLSRQIAQHVLLILVHVHQFGGVRMDGEGSLRVREHSGVATRRAQCAPRRDVIHRVLVRQLQLLAARVVIVLDDVLLLPSEGAEDALEVGIPSNTSRHWHVHLGHARGVCKVHLPRLQVDADPTRVLLIQPPERSKVSRRVAFFIVLHELGRQQLLCSLNVEAGAGEGFLQNVVLGDGRGAKEEVARPDEGVVSDAVLLDPKGTQLELLQLLVVRQAVRELLVHQLGAIGRSRLADAHPLEAQREGVQTEPLACLGMLIRVDLTAQRCDASVRDPRLRRDLPPPRRIGDVSRKGHAERVSRYNQRLDTRCARPARGGVARVREEQRLEVVALVDAHEVVVLLGGRLPIEA